MGVSEKSPYTHLETNCLCYIITYYVEITFKVNICK